MEALRKLREVMAWLTARPDSAPAQFQLVREAVEEALVTARDQLEQARSLDEGAVSSQLMDCLEAFRARWAAARSYEDFALCQPELVLLEAQLGSTPLESPEEPVLPGEDVLLVVDSLEQALNELQAYCGAGQRQQLEAALTALSEAERGLSGILER